MVQHGVAQRATALHSMALCSTLWCSVVSCGMAWHGVARYVLHFCSAGDLQQQDTCILPRRQCPTTLSRYTGPPELFTCFACLWGSPQLLRQLNKFPAHWVADHVALLRQLRHKYEMAHGQTPHPITLMTEALCHLRSGLSSLS